MPVIRADLLARPAASAAFPCFVVSSPRGATRLDARETRCVPSLHLEPVNEEIEIDSRTGGLTLCTTDLLIEGPPSVPFTRCLATQDRTSRAFGVGGNHIFEIMPIGSRFPYTYIDLVLVDGHLVHYSRISDGGGYADAVYQSFAGDTSFLRSRIAWNGNGWDLTRPDGVLIRFPENYAGTRPRHGAPTEMRLMSGDSIRLERDDDRNLEQIRPIAGGAITLTHDPEGRVVKATDTQGRVLRYAYNREGNLSSISGDNVAWTYLYDGPRLTTVLRGQEVWLDIGYIDDRVMRLRIQDGREFRFDGTAATH